MTGIGITYFLRGSAFAFRRRDQAPRVGDYVRFGGVHHEVEMVVWVEPQEGEPSVQIVLKEPEAK
ncbi:putative Nuclease [Pseudomonas sp. IT-P171]|uniref:hypothetical protein n=1 Tax=Pseudomonas sp. IT-P171 TaxID=3026453 RepID=UPI0039E1AC18